MNENNHIMNFSNYIPDDETFYIFARDVINELYDEAHRRCIDSQVTKEIEFIDKDKNKPPLRYIETLEGELKEARDTLDFCTLYVERCKKIY